MLVPGIIFFLLNYNLNFRRIKSVEIKDLFDLLYISCICISEVLNRFKIIEIQWKSILRLISFQI